MTAVFSHGRLRLYLLKLLDDGPKHGYELIRLLEDRFLGLYAPSAGTMKVQMAGSCATGRSASRCLSSSGSSRTWRPVSVTGSRDMTVTIGAGAAGARQNIVPIGRRCSARSIPRPTASRR